MNCKPFEDKWHFNIKHPPAANTPGEFDMTKIVYTTQGTISNQTQSQRHSYIFREQCKNENIPTYPKFFCPSTCDNQLSLDYVTKKLTH